ncbi:MAG: hypothetical protein ABIZ91_12740, partial [Gemmatimonadaceae bacterium]
MSAACDADRIDGHLLALVISHTDAPAAVREQLSLDDATQRALMAAADARASVIQGIATLSTCSRTELYAVVRSPVEGLSALRTLMARHSGAPDEVIDRMRAVRGDAVVRHIMRVSSGLESLMLGEHEILGQLREMLHRTV